MSEPLLFVRSLARSFEAGGEVLEVLRGIELTLHRGLVERHGIRRVLGFHDSGQAQDILAHAGSAHLSTQELYGPGGQAGEREDIVNIVFEHGAQRAGIASAQRRKVDVRNHRAWHIKFAFHTEYVALQATEAAPDSASAPEPSRRIEHVEMAARDGRIEGTIGGEARLQQWNVEGPAIVRDEPINVPQSFRQRP